MDKTGPQIQGAGPIVDDTANEISLWPSKPNETDLAPGAGHAAPTRPMFDGRDNFKNVYVTNGKGEESKVQIPLDAQAPANVLGRNLDEVASTLPKYTRQSLSPPNSPNRYRFPGAENGPNNDSAEPQTGSDALIPPIESIPGEDKVPRLQPAGWNAHDGRSANGQHSEAPAGTSLGLSAPPHGPSEDESAEGAKSAPRGNSSSSADKLPETYRVIARPGTTHPSTRNGNRPPRLTGRGKDVLDTPPTAMSHLRLQDELSDEGPSRAGPSIPNKRSASNDDGDVLEGEEENEEEGSNRKKKRKTVGRYKCTFDWCKETFTRRGDVQRHVKNAAVHRDKNNPAANNDKRCKFCGSDLSRADARARHERAGACGKRSFAKREQQAKANAAVPSGSDTQMSGAEPSTSQSTSIPAAPQDTPSP